MTFKEKVLKIVGSIPKGKVLTYQSVAAFCDSPKASRAVGNIMKKNYDPKILCHRVVRSDGKIGQYNRGISKKEKQLMDEGAILKNGKLRYWNPTLAQINRIITTGSRRQALSASKTKEAQN